jgi:o-succinylbenzoate---CoA ligase
MIPRPLARLARSPASAPALAWPGGGMSCGALLDRIETLARSARLAGPPGSPLAVLAASRLNLVIGVLVALRLGRPALPLDPARADVDACLAACGAGGVLRDGGIAGAAAEATPAGITAEGAHTALMVATSGTSGAPRVAMLTAAALDAHVAASGAVLPPLSPGDRWLVCLPMTSIGALAALWRTLSAGACLAFMERFDADQARGLIAAGVSHLSVVPAMLEPLAAGPAPAPTGLRCVLSGGGALTAPMAEHALAREWPLWNGWGMTETSSHVAVGRVDETWREGVVGHPLPGVDLNIEAATGRLLIGGPMLMSGYAGVPAAAGLEPDGRLLSSDLGEFLEDGRVRILGRADDVLVTGGVNVHPQAVEMALAGCADAGEVAVTARPDARWGQVLVALYTGSAAPAALDAWARERLPSTARPREFLRVASLPRNEMGKLMRTVLPELFEKG